ncbi:MAG: bifunctional methylenetetrahydrofolate dehydrogenase/methenyltetrahydrofolate cyclohydrolase FolD [Hyphomicrobiaceae bacterium]|nr:bifunctional methylenetetrahydrofolate dehydrogenase/methenyltetrahydrofolate cyclohydrolase FolD [Hyphomicrobiaceae bacterium]
MADVHVIDGKAIAARVRAEVQSNVARLKRDHGFVPGLAVVLVGEDPASKVYVKNKAQQTLEVGMKSVEHKLPVETSEAALLELVGQLNRDDTIHGILVQMPLPKQIDALKVIEAIDPMKDVDGFHAVNVGRLSIGERALVPCTPSGSLILAKTVKKDLTGLHAVVIGRSNIVGKPMAQLLIRESCTVTVAHSKTADLPAVCRTADILVAAVGRPEMVKASWIKPGAIVIDVGINRVTGADGKGRLVGDVAYDECAAVAGAITPVPGGVGPMTIACLLKNTVEAAEMQHGLPVTEIQV